MLTEPFMQRALLVALALGPLCGFLGVFVTARRMAFFSDTIAHAALAGVAVGFWLGTADPTLPMLAVCLAVAFLILWLKERTALLTDTLMAILLSTSVAFGLVVMSLLKNARGELDRFLFGDIISVGWNDVTLAAIVATGVGMALLFRLNDLVLLATHEDLAHVSGIRVRRLNQLFVTVLTLTVALSIRLLGIILVTSLLVVPAAAARNLATSLRQQLLLSLLVGVSGAIGGVLLSYPLNAPTGPLICLTLAGIFAISIGVEPLRRRRGRRSLPGAPGKS